MQGRLLTVSTVLIVSTVACGGSDDTADDADDANEAAAASAPAETDGSGDDDAADDGDDAPDAEVSAGDASTFGNELEDGSTLTVHLDVEETDPLVAPFVAFREQAGATDDVVWIVGSLDAPADFEDPVLGGPPTGRLLTFVPEGGDPASETNPMATFACSKLDDWFGSPSGDEGAVLNESYIEIFDSSCGNQSAQVVGEVGAVTDYVMVFEGSSLPEFGGLWAGLLAELEPVG